MDSHKLIIMKKQYIGKRLEQQDSIAVIPDREDTDTSGKGFLALLCDGMGGMSHGDVFSGLGITAMTEAFLEADESEDMHEILVKCFAKAQDAARAIQKDDEKGGSTVTAVYCRGDSCATLSCGDSTIGLIRNGGLIRLNREHSLGRILNEQGAMDLIAWEDALSSGQRNALFSYLGSDRKGMMLDLDSHPFRIKERDTLLLMSDGVTSALSDEEIAQIIMEEQEPDKAIIDAITNKDKPSQDNCSIIIIGVR